MSQHDTQPYPFANDYTTPLDGNEPAWAIRLITRVEIVGSLLDAVRAEQVKSNERMSRLEADFLHKWSTKQKLITIFTALGTGAGTLILSKVPALGPALEQLSQLLKGLG